MRISLHKRTCYSIVFIVVNLLFARVAIGQQSGDYRSKTTGNWSALSTWERYNGSAWSTPTSTQGYPGEKASTASVIIQANHTITYNKPSPAPSTITTINSLSIANSGTLSFQDNADLFLNIIGNLSVLGSFKLDNSNGARNSYINIGGNITIEDERTFNMVSPDGTDHGYITFNGTGVQTIDGNATSITFYDLTINKALGAFINTGGNIAFISVNNLTQTQGNFTAPTTLNINGNFVHSAGSFVANSGLVNFNGTSLQTISGAQSTQFNNVTINNNTGVLLAQDIVTNGTITVNGLLNTSSKMVSGSGSFILNNIGTLIISNTGGIDGSITVTGAKTFSSSGGSYTFETATSSPFPSAMPASAIISNLNIGANVTINKDISVSGTLTLNNGLLSIPSDKKLTLTNPNAISFGSTAFGNSKHIVTQVDATTGKMGVLQVNNIPTSGFDFPIGNGTYYLPATIKPSVVTNFGVTVFQGATTNGQPNGAIPSSEQKSKIVDAVWNITGSVPATLTLKFPNAAALKGTAFASASDANQGISHFTNGQWDVADGLVDGDVNAATRYLTSFSPQVVSLSGLNVLPVHFSNVRASEKASGVQVDFTNLTESDVAFYEVERSLDGNAFSAVKRLAPNKNNYGSAAYNYLDATAKEGRLSYRIKAVETTGKIIYSSVVNISLGVAKYTGMTVYAKGGQVALQVGNLPQGKYQVQLFSAAGQLLGAESITHGGGSLSQTTSLKGAKAGLYILNINGTATRLQQKFMVQ